MPCDPFHIRAPSFHIHFTVRHGVWRAPWRGLPRRRSTSRPPPRSKLIEAPARRGRGARGTGNAGSGFRWGRAASLPPTKGYFVNRLWSRVGVRATAVGLLVLGVAGGVYLGHDKEVQQQSAEAQLVVQADADEMQLLKERQSEHAAARAWQREAESDAAAKAAAEAKAAASKARTLEKKAIAKAAADKAAAAKAKSESGATVPYTGPIPTS